MATNKTKLTASDRKILKSFGSKVRAIREGKKLSVYDVTGEDMPIKTRQHWQAIENGNKNIQLTTIVKIAEALGVNTSDLF